MPELEGLLLHSLGYDKGLSYEIKAYMCLNSKVFRDK